jgi:hypothetical protein
MVGDSASSLTNSTNYPSRPSTPSKSGGAEAPRDVRKASQTLARRLDAHDPTTFDLIIVDEAHHATAREWRRVIEHFNPLLTLGLSATPERSDGAPLSSLFSIIAYSAGIQDAVNAGALTTPIALVIKTGVNLDQVKRQRGDFDQHELQSALNTRNRNRIILDAFKQHAGDRKTICFTAGVQHARDLALLFREHGIRATSIAGNDANRREKLDALRKGTHQVSFNAALLVEGFDDPTIDCVLMARPTHSRVLYTQAIGRALRTYPGKADALIVDFSDASTKHRLVNLWDFWGTRLKRRLNKPTNLTTLTELSPTEIDDTEWDPVAYAQLIDILKPPPQVDEQVLNAHKWHALPATEMQLTALKNLGYDTTHKDWTRGQASVVIGNENATAKQNRLLLALGSNTIGIRWTRSEASAAINASTDSTPDWSLVNRLQANGVRKQTAA